MNKFKQFPDLNFVGRSTVYRLDIKNAKTKQNQKQKNKKKKQKNKQAKNTNRKREEKNN